MPHGPAPDTRGHDGNASQRTLVAGGGAPDDPPPVLAADVERAEPAADAPVGAVTAGMMTLAHQMITATASTGTNVVMSPLSIAYAFAMARVGAVGATASQLDSVFGFPASGRDDAFNAITRDLVTTAAPPMPSKWEPGTPPPTPLVAIGDALFTANDLAIGDAFLQTLAAHFGAGARPVDFTLSAAVEQINAWVRSQTAGRITSLFDQLDPSTRFVIANTVYFKAYWRSMFDEFTTRKAPFTRDDGSPVDADMMSDVMSVRYANVRGFQAVELPYVGGPYAMWLALPPAGGRPLDALDPATVVAITNAMSTERVTVSMPRFDFSANVDLADTLTALGLTVPFGVQADFSGISPGLSISQAVHSANITVTEDGTEAAAASGLTGVTSVEIAPPLSFVADRPFAFIIVGGPDRVPLFVGQVADPTQR